MVDVNIFDASVLFHLLAVFGAFLAAVIAFVYFGLRYMGDVDEPSE